MSRDSTHGIERFLAELVEIPSHSCGEEPLMLRLEQELSDLSFRVQRIPIDGRRFNLLARYGEGRPIVCLNAHADTVPPIGSSVPKASVQSGILRGLGSADDKASIAAMVVATRMVLESGLRLKGTLDVLISVDEEGDAQGVRRAISEGYRCDMAVVGEPTNLEVVSTHCGMVFLLLETHGRSTHGSLPMLGENAIEEMFELVREIKSSMEGWPSSDSLGPPSLNLGAVHGGDRANIVPDRCEGLVDIRFVPPVTSCDVLRSVEAVISRRSGKADYTVTKSGECLDTPANSRLVQSLCQAAEAVTGTTPSVGGWRGWTEAEPFQTMLGIDAVVFGPGSLEQAHSADEFVQLHQVSKAADIYAETVLRLLA